MRGMLARIMQSTTLVRLAVLTLLVVASWWGTAVPLHAQGQEDSAVCSVATLKGAYGVFRTGATAVGPLAAVGIATFDGTGAVSTARQTIRKNGVTTSDLFTDPAIEGPYEVDPDCAARFLMPDGTVFAHAVIVDGGNELFILSLSNGNSVYGVMKKIGKRQH
jgi:hypothetical protein